MHDKTVNSELTRVLHGAGSATNSGLRQAIGLVVTGGSATDGVAAPIAANGAQSGLAQAIVQNTAQLGQVHSTLQGQLDSMVANTQALIENTTAKSTGAAVASMAGSFANSVLGGGLIGSLVSGLTHLFGGGSGNQAPTPLLKFALPPKLNYEGGTQGPNIGSVDYGQNGQPRPVQTPTPHVTVNVSAMDSRSFLDHSSEIAKAVRRAMLESSSLNDVIGDM